jgi:hypothetical protein
MKITPELRTFLGFGDDGRWEPPAGMDPEAIGLCRAMNAFPGIVTTESCCGHGEKPFRIWFLAGSLKVLPALLWCFDACHSGQRGWSVTASTDCVADHVTFVAEGPCGGYAAAEAVAVFMNETLAPGPAAGEENGHA